MTKAGEIELRKREDEIRMLHIELKEVRRSMEATRKTLIRARPNGCLPHPPLPHFPAHNQRCPFSWSFIEFCQLKHRSETPPKS